MPFVVCTSYLIHSQCWGDFEENIIQFGFFPLLSDDKHEHFASTFLVSDVVPGSHSRKDGVLMVPVLREFSFRPVVVATQSILQEIIFN